MARYVDADKAPIYLNEAACEQIKMMPTEYVEEVKHGYWEEIKTGEKLYDYCFKCSNCNNETPPNSFVVSPDYCPHCGAKMDGGKAE